MATNTLWIWDRDWIVPIWKWGAINSRFHTGIPIWKRGDVSFDSHMETVIRRFHMGMCQHPFPYGDPV